MEWRIRGADDALWEWNLRTDQARFSPRWTALVGSSGEELVGSIQEWWNRVHPDDSEVVQRAVQDHLAGRTSHLHSEHRLHHQDGGWRWVRARGKLVADSMGIPVRMVGLISDITASRRVQEAVIELANGLSTLSGEECLRKLVRSFAAVLGVREAFVCECSDYPTTRVRMLARWKAGEHARCVEFDLAGTACEDVIRSGHTVFAPHDAGERWPLEKQYERLSYLGLSCLDSAGRVIGHIACADDKPMREDLPHQAILKIFAHAGCDGARAGRARTDSPGFCAAFDRSRRVDYEPGQYMNRRGFRKLVAGSVGSALSLDKDEPHLSVTQAHNGSWGLFGDSRVHNGTRQHRSWKRPAIKCAVNQCVRIDSLATNQGVVGSNPAGRATNSRGLQTCRPFQFASVLRRFYAFSTSAAGTRSAWPHDGWRNPT